MRKLYSTLALAALLGLARGDASAEKIHPKAGTSSAAFLKIPVGARPVAMGEAFTAVADDLNALYWNPAGMAGLERATVGATHQEAYEGINHEFAGFIQPRPGARAWGLSLIILNVPADLERRSGASEGGLALGQITSPEGTFGATDSAVGASYAMRTSGGDVGATVRWIRQTIDNVSGNTGALDLGWRRDEVIPNLSLGAALHNLGPGITLRQSYYPLPLTGRVGAAYRVKPLRATLAMDASVVRDDFPIFAWGGEVGITENIFWRAGYRYRWYGNPLGALSGFRTGLGFVYKGFSIDYAVAPFGELGNSHRISLAWRLGRRFVGGVQANPSPSTPPALDSVPVNSVPSPVAVVAVSPPPPLPSLPLPPPEEPGPVLEFTRYAVQADARTVTGRGTDFQVEAKAPRADMDMRAVEFRVTLPSAKKLAVEVAEDRPEKPLSFGRAAKVYYLRLNITPIVRAVAFKFRASDPAPSFMGRFGNDWRALEATAVTSDGETVLKLSTDRLPGMIAVLPAP